MPAKPKGEPKPKKPAVAKHRDDGLDAAGLVRKEYIPEPRTTAKEAAPQEEIERLLSDEDILALMPSKHRDSIGLREMHQWLDANTESIAKLYKTCGALSTLWKPRKDSSGENVVTLCHFWRYAELIGLGHIAPVSALTKQVRPQSRHSRFPPAEQPLSISEFCLGLAEIASSRCTCLTALKYFGIGSHEDKLGDRLDALLKGISSSMGSLLGVGEPLGCEHASSIFRHELSGGVQRLCEVMCDEDGTLPLSEARKLLLSADTLKPAGTRNVGSMALASVANTTAAPRAPPPNEILELLAHRKGGFADDAIAIATTQGGGRIGDDGSLEDKIRLTAAELLDALGRHAIAACPELSTAEAVAKMWGPLLGGSSPPLMSMPTSPGANGSPHARRPSGSGDQANSGAATGAATSSGRIAVPPSPSERSSPVVARMKSRIGKVDPFGQNAIMSMVMPASDNPPSEELASSAHVLFSHFASHSWHGDARAESGEPCAPLLRQPGWKLMTSLMYAHRRIGSLRTTLHLAEDGGRGADPAFYACAITIKREGSKETRSALNESGCIQALRMLACRVVLARRAAARDISDESDAWGVTVASSRGTASPLTPGSRAPSPPPREPPSARDESPAAPGSRGPAARSRGGTKMTAEAAAAAAEEAAAAMQADAETQAATERALALAAMRAEVDELLIEVLGAVERRLGFYLVRRRSPNGALLGRGVLLGGSASTSSLASSIAYAGVATAKATKEEVVEEEEEEARDDAAEATGVTDAGMDNDDDEASRRGGDDPASPLMSDAAPSPSLDATAEARPKTTAKDGGIRPLPDPFEIFATAEHALRLLRAHPSELANLFHAYASPCEPRPSSATAAVAWAASSGVARYDSSLPSELRGVGPAGLSQLCEDFALVRLLRCPANVLQGYASRMGGRPLSLLQLALVLLRACAHGEAVRLAQRQLEMDGRWDSRDDDGMHSSGSADVGEGQLPLDGDGIEMLRRALMLHSPAALTSRILAFGRRLPPASLLLPLPSSPRALPDERELSCVRMGQADLATRLHALVALADADDPRLAAPPPPVLTSQTAAAATHTATLAGAAGPPHSRRPGSAGALDSVAVGSAATAALAAAAARSASKTSQHARLMLQPLIPPAGLPHTSSALLQQAALLAADGDAARSIAALRKARLAYADAICPAQTSADAQESFPPTAAIFFELAMARAANAAGTELSLGASGASKARVGAEGGGGDAGGDGSGVAMAHAGSAWLAATYIDPQDSAAHADVACELGAAAYDLGRYEVGAALFARALEARYALMTAPPLAEERSPRADGERGIYSDEDEDEDDSEDDESEEEDDEEDDALHVAECMNNLAACAAAMGDGESPSVQKPLPLLLSVPLLTRAYSHATVACTAPAAVRLYRRCHALLVSEFKPSHPAMMILLHNLNRQLRMPGVPLTLRGTEAPPFGMRPRLVDEPRLWVSYCESRVKGRGGGGKKGKKGGKKGKKGGKKKGGKKKGGKKKK